MVKKRLNVQLLLVLAGALAAAAVVTHAVHVWMTRGHVERMIAQADAAEADGQLARAADYLHRALLLRPGDSATLLRYARALERLAVTPPEKAQLRSVYKQVLARDPANQDVRRKLVALEMEAGDLDDARKHLLLLLQAAPADAESHDLLGRLHERAGELPRAAEEYRRALDAAPDRVETAMRLASLLRLQMRLPEDADAVLDTLVDANPNSPVALAARAAWRTTFGALDDAAKDVERAVQLAPEDADVLALDAEMQQLLGRPDAARESWKHALRLKPREPRLYLGLGGLEMRAGHRDEALANFRAGLEKLPDNPDLLHAACDALLELKRPDEAAALVARLREPGMPPGLAEYLDARILMLRGRWAEAERSLRRTAETPGVSTELLSRIDVCLGHCWGRLGAPDRRLAAFNDAVNVDRYFPPAQMGLAAALLDAGRADEALEHLRWLTRLASADEASWVLLARALLENNLTLPAAKRDWAEVRAALDRASRSVELATDVTLLEARLLQARGKPAEAAAVLERACRDHPDEAAFWKARAELAAASGDADAAAKALEEGRQKASDRAAATAAALEFWERQGGPGAVRFLGRLEAELPPAPPEGRAEEWRKELRLLAEADLRLGRAGDAQRLARELVRSSPADDVASRALLAEALLAGGAEDVKAALADLRKAEGEDGTWWPALQAAWLLRRARAGEKGAVDRAAELLAEVERRRPGWGRADLLRGELQEQKGDPNAAAEAYLRAVDDGERAPGVGLRTVQLLAAQERFADADRVARRFQAAGPLRPDFARLAAEVAMRAGSTERALELASQAVRPGDPDYRSQLWLGAVQAAAGRDSDAEHSFRRAAELAPSLPDPWLALVAHLSRTGQAGRAAKELARLRQKVAAEDLPLTLARCLEILARWKDASEQYQAALAQHPDDANVLRSAAAYYLRLGEEEKARPLLERLRSPEVAAPEEALAWARRQEALLLAGPGAAEERVRRALALLDGNRNLVGDAAADRRARAFAEAAQPEGRAAALRRLDELAASQPLSGEEQARLARLVEDEDWPRSSQLYRGAVAADPENPAHLAGLAAALLRHDEPDEARTLVGRLEKVEPDSARTRDLRAKLSERSP